MEVRQENDEIRMRKLVSARPLSTEVPIRWKANDARASLESMMRALGAAGHQAQVKIARRGAA